MGFLNGLKQMNGFIKNKIGKAKSFVKNKYNDPTNWIGNLVMLQPKRTPNNIVQGIRFAMIPVIGAGIGYGTYKLRQHWNKVQPYYNKFTNGVTNATNWMFHKIGNITSNILNRNSNDVNITRSHE